MLTKTRKFLFLVIFAVFAFVLVGCTEERSLQKIADGLNVPTETSAASFTLTVSSGETTIEWISSNEDVIAIDGRVANVTHGENDVEVTLTANLTRGEVTATKEFTVKVLKATDPTAITIGAEGLRYDSTEEAYIMVLASTAQLYVETEPEDAFDGVVWQSGSSKKATVDETGKVTALDYGTVTIKATSKRNPAVTATIKLLITDSTEPNAVLLAARNSITEQLPEFVTGSFRLPKPANGAVEVVYTDSAGVELPNGDYMYEYVNDTLETIYATVSYKDATYDFNFQLQIVEDKEANDFTAMQYAKEQLDEFFAAYLSGEKVAEDIELPTEYTIPSKTETDTEKDDAQVVNISWTSDSSYGPNPINSSGKYTKPNDDAIVKFEAYITSGHNDRVERYTVTASGYTKEEIVDYVKENVLPQADGEGKYVLTGANLTLPTGDLTGKFTATAIEWSTSNAEVLAANGKFVNPYLDTPTEVTLTAVIKYAGTVGSEFAFEETIQYQYTVNPAANTAQAIALELSGYLETPEFLAKVQYFPFGVEGREGGNVLPIPSKISEVTTEAMTSYQDLAIAWSCKEDGLFDENMKLLKQYLRYHEAVISYAVTYGDDTATNEIVINVGVAELKNTMYIGGWFNVDQSGGGVNVGDCLSALSKFDDSVGTVATRSQYWGTNTYGASAAWSGYTYYIDEVDEAGVVTRYQFYVQTGTIATLDEEYDETEYKLSTTAEEAMVKTFGGNWGIFFINNTDKDLKVPMSPYTGGPKPIDTPEDSWAANDKFGRDNGFSYDGYRVGFTSLNDGTIVFGNGETVIQGIMKSTEPYVVIPAHGYGMTYKYMYNNASLVGRFCKPGQQITIKHFTAYHLDTVDGSTDGLTTYQH